MQLALAESATPDDEVVEVDGLKLLYRKANASFFAGRKLDYSTSPFGFGQYHLLTV